MSRYTPAPQAELLGRRSRVMDAPSSQSLPEAAYRKLAAGESYQPMVPAAQRPPEATARAVLFGLFFCALFSVAAVYSGMKVGQVMEAAIPISILAIGLSRAFGMHLLENVIITGIGGVSAAVVAGAIFTLPALYMLQLSPNILQTSCICIAGGCLGVLFLLPLRRYFVREMHGEFPYPEATAITEVLVTGEKGGSQARLLVQASVFAGVYDFLVTYWGAWREIVDLRWIGLMRTLEDKARIVLQFDAIAFILGLGYVMGLRSSMLLCAGGVLSNFVLVPLIWFVGENFPGAAVYPAAKPIAEMTANEIFRGYIRLIGVGAIATAGIFGIIRSLPILFGAFAVAARTFRKGEDSGTQRTDTDMKASSILIGLLLSTLAVAILLKSLGSGLGAVVVGVVLAIAFSFLFTSVAANAIATTARNPVSGMTMLTIIVSSVVLLNFGLSGATGMFFVMAIAGMVCTALSVSGQAITDLKVGYWLGSTPAVQQRVKFYGVIVASVASAATMWLLWHVGYRFGEAPEGWAPDKILAAPQASIMKALVENFMNRQPVAYLLLGIGASIAVVLEMLRVPALTFALGMYLPLELNSPALVGGFLHHLITTRSERLGGAEGETWRSRAIVIASGLMAGGALGGVLGVLLQLKQDWSGMKWLGPQGLAELVPWRGEAGLATSESIAIVGFVGVCLYLWFWAKPRK